MPQARGVDDLIEVRRAADLVQRTPETVRRWIWSGRLPATRRGNRLVVSRRELERVARGGTGATGSLAAWAREAAQHNRGRAGSGVSAADLVLEDRATRQDG